MTYTEILELIRAGYTKAEIDLLMQPAPATPPEAKEGQEGGALLQEQTPVGTDQEKKQEKQESVPSTPSPPSEIEKLVAALGMKLDTLTTAIHAANVGGMENPNNQLTPEQVVAQIINPHLNDK